MTWKTPFVNVRRDYDERPEQTFSFAALAVIGSGKIR
jgi:hypothetical protein